MWVRVTARLRCTTVFRMRWARIRLSHVVENTDIPTSELSDHTRSLLRNAITAKDLDDAHQIVSRLKTQADQTREKAEQAAASAFGFRFRFPELCGTPVRLRALKHRALIRHPWP